MQKIYSRINWENFPSEKTAVNESNLNKMDLAIDNLDDRVVAMDASKVDLTKANELVKEILWDESNGTLTVVKMNGSRAVIDTKLEKLAVNFTYNPQTQQLVITLDDGTVQNVDLSSLITEYEFLDSDTIAFEITDGKVKAIVKNGSITEDHISPDYLGEIRTQVGKAETSAKSADASEKNAASSSVLAKSYAVGGTGTRDGEDTDNAKYYAEQAKNASDVGALAEKLEQHTSNRTIHVTNSEKDIVSKLGESAEGILTFNGKDVIGSTITVDDALSPTSANPVQNKVVTSNLTDLKYGEVAGGSNIFNISDFIKYYNLSEADGTYYYVADEYIYANEKYIPFDGRAINFICSSDYLSYLSKFYRVACYDSNKEFLKRLSGVPSATVTKLTLPEGTKYVRLGINFDTPDRLKNMAFTKSDFYEPYIPSVKMLENEKADKSETAVNLLKPTLETITENGVTCTNNGDGTYTLNGTATSNVRFQFGIDDNLIVGKTYKALGIPIDGSYSTILMGWDNHGYFNKEGTVDKKTSEPRPISMQVIQGYTCDNLVFKPMLTTNLNATYDDFVPYTGDTGKLNGDVAELKAQSVKKDNVVNNQTTTVEGFALDARQANPNLDGTLAKQLSDLNGSLEKLNDFTDILSNDNLNDSKFFNVGKYCCSFNGVAATVLNSPFNTAFTMEAFQSAGTPQYIAQKAIEFESGHCKWRVKDTVAGTIIQDWAQLY